MVTNDGGRVRSAFNVERVTKRFYDNFKKERQEFLKSIEGINDAAQKDWYASLMLNRLMFIYFIQRKEFLDGDRNYLRNRLALMRERHGSNGSHSFYKIFLRKLFHDGLNKQDRPRELTELLGKIPYLNGGLFDVHTLEREHPAIEIPDAAFARVFAFFDEYDWCLDDRPLRDEREINPDVLGYIFEKYINQKQMGAYYTKEDITEYIAKNTIIPFLFDRARELCPDAFDTREGIWRLLRENPDRYIHGAVQHGVIERGGTIKELPGEIAAGVANVNNRSGWNKPAPPEYGLPTENWREHVARRERCLELRRQLASGEVTDVNALITLNLDIRQFTQDVLATHKDPNLIAAFYRAIAGRVPENSDQSFEQGLSVLDPACGSGAFLFAALNILQPIIETCLERMHSFVEEADGIGKAGAHPSFRRVLAEAGKHANVDYFILKSIIVGNLYGVDIMEEATEICKLRLFLKLIANLERDDARENMGLEPLPDIDFNIRAGNTLIGFVDEASVDRAFAGERQGTFDYDDTKGKFKDDAEIAKRIFEQFRSQQTRLGDAVTPADKADLRGKLKQLSDKLDICLAHQYGVDTSDQTISGEFSGWRKSHQPFHWFTEFYGIIAGGGFDVIIGNPPYVEYSRVRDEYALPKNCYETESTGNLYAFAVERSKSVLQPTGSLSMILPLSAFCTQRMTPLISMTKQLAGTKWIAHFGWRPAKLFDGVNIPLSILLLRAGENKFFTTTFAKWYSEKRQAVFPTVQYTEASEFLKFDHVIPKIGAEIERRILQKVFAKKKTLEAYQSTNGNDAGTFFYRNTGGLYWRIFTDFRPYFAQDGVEMSSSTEATLRFKNEELLTLTTGVLNSNLYWFFYVVFSSFHHVNPPDILEFPVDFDDMTGELKRDLLTATSSLMNDMKAKSQIRQRTHKGGHVSNIQTFFPSLSKPLNDKIDALLTRTYDFTPEEMDYILNYDIKTKTKGA